MATETNTPNGDRTPPLERLAYSVADFCAAIGISRAHYYNEKKAGRGPREMHVGARVFISPEAAADWRLERERSAEREAA